MIAVLFAAVFAAGAFLVYDGLTRPEQGSRVGSRWGRLDRATAFLRQAGVEGVSARDFLLACGAAGLAIGVVAQLLLGWVLVSVAAAFIGAVVPLAYLARRRERRRDL